MGLVAAYAVWRVTQTSFRHTGPLHLAFEVLYDVLEVVLISASLRMMSLLRDRIERSGEATRNLGWWTHREDGSPLIDVLIPTYNEPTRVIERSIAGAKQLHYDNFRIWVLDDGVRPSVAALARRMGVDYLARADRTGAKAGNLNHAVSHLLTLERRPELVAVVDCDYVLQPEFMRRCLALMKDPRVGLVQTPQLFWNPDPFQAAFPAGAPLPDDLRFSYDTVHPAQDARGAAWCKGTSFIMRVETIQDIGGFPTESLVEDVLTTQRMQVAGWKTSYLDEALSFGLAAESLDEFLMQRHRWAKGFAQIGRLEWDNRSGRSLRLRFAKTEVRVRWAYTALVQSVLILGVPSAFWWLRLRPYHASGMQMLLWGLPMLLFFRGYVAWLSDGRNLPIFREANQLVQVSALVGGAWCGIRRPHHRVFIVTAKGLQRSRTVVYWRKVAWIAAGLGIVAGGALWRLLVQREGPDQWRDPAMMAWTGYACVVCVLAAFMCVEPVNRRREQRFPGRRTPIELVRGERQRLGWIEDISCSGMLVGLSPPLDIEEDEEDEKGENDQGPESDAARTVRVRLGEVGWVDARIVRRPSPAQLALELLAEGTPKERLICYVLSLRFVSPVVRGRLFGASLAALTRLHRGIQRAVVAPRRQPRSQRARTE